MKESLFKHQATQAFISDAIPSRRMSGPGILHDAMARLLDSSITSRGDLTNLFALERIDYLLVASDPPGPLSVSTGRAPDGEGRSSNGKES